MKIPDDVFETRCRYCQHGRPWNENSDVPEHRVFVASYHDKLPCQIFGISKCREVPGECLSFSPLAYFGICGTCQYSNSFCEGFCTRGEQPNKRQLFLGNGGLGGAYKPDYWMTHVLSTCDNYIVRGREADRIIKAVAEGRSPENFDPTTLKAIRPADRNTVAEEWLRIQTKAKEDRDQIAAKKAEKARELQALNEGRDPTQVSIFDILEGGTA